MNTTDITPQPRCTRAADIEHAAGKIQHVPLIPCPAGVSTSDLQAGIDRINDGRKALPKLRALADDTAAKLTQLENSCSLDDKSALGEIARLQVLSTLLSRRIA